MELIYILLVILHILHRFEGQNIDSNSPSYYRHGELRRLEVFPDDYDKYQPPWTKSNPAAVYLQLSVMDIDKIDDGAMEYSLQSYLGEFWKDYRLNVSGFQTSIDTYLNFPSSLAEHMWVPDLVFDNTKNGIVFHLAQPNRVIRLLQDGSFLRSTRYNFIVGCQMNFRLYPLDTQKCFLKIASMANNDLKLSLHWAEELATMNQESVIFTNDIQPLKYILGKTKLYKNTETWTSGNYTFLYANFTFTRRISGSIFNTYIPSTLVVFLSWISFWLDIEAVPARITLGVTSLLTLATQMVEAHSGLPPISYLTAMNIWLFVCLLTVFSSVIEFAISYHLHITKKQKTSEKRSVKNAFNIVPDEKFRLFKARIHEDTILKTIPKRKDPRRSVKNSFVKNKQISLDKISRKLFPVLFFIFVITYWTYYLYLIKE